MEKISTVYELKKQKGKRTLIQLHVDNVAEAAAAADVGIDILSCEAGRTLEGIRNAAPYAFVSAGLPNYTIARSYDGIRLGFKALKAGASAVYCSSGPRIIEAMAKEGIPVIGHVGLVPNHATWTKFRAVGKTGKEAHVVYKNLKTLESAGACAVEIEVVPVQLAEYLTQNTHMITMGMGAGSGCDTQYLFSSDVLGTHNGHYPRHAKKYADLLKLEEEMQAARIQAFSLYAKEVATSAFPEPEHEIQMTDDEYQKFMDLADKA
ncbi:MAG: 3-methyl-2-oxobutanoate hydroxymethyltransferase [Rhizobiaceae bacterium]|nr:3-methyl-2-oxobutanoate hydroxymethyltransferase [Rhizobiaceae bacterium]